MGVYVVRTSSLNDKYTVIWKKFVGKIFSDGWAHPKIIYSEKIAQRIFRTLIITVYRIFLHVFDR